MTVEENNCFCHFPSYYKGYSKSPLFFNLEDLNFNLICKNGNSQLNLT
jgi:hypothetical protein